MKHLADLDRAALAAGLTAAKADGWLLFEFRAINPVSLRILGTNPGTRRLFVYLPKLGPPVAIAHRIELQPLENFPGRVIPYSQWQELDAALKEVVGGKTVAMETYPKNAVPVLDRVPHGVIQLLESVGTKVVSSAPLVTNFAARWSASEVKDHMEAAEVLASVAKTVIAEAVTEGGKGLTESALQARVVALIEQAGFRVDPGHRPIIGFGPNAANPHYSPMPGTDRTLAADEVVLVDLFAGRTLATVFADQTWMGFSGRNPPAEVVKVWNTVRDARDAALAAVWGAAREKRPLLGFEVDRAARQVIEAAGYGPFFVHRTGHSIDRDLHGSGPNCDDFETRDDREMMPGVGFSVEPGIYLPGRFGVRSEVNVYWSADGPVCTPGAIQRELILP